MNLAESTGLVLRNALVIDGTGADPIEGATVIIEGRRIREIGKGRERVPAHFEEIDLGGSAVLPGLMDLHVHIHSVYTEPDALHYDVPRTAMLAARRAELALLSGVTTLRDAGAQNGVSFALKRETEKGVIVGSRIVPMGGIIAVTGGHGWKRSGIEADGPYGLRQMVREQLKLGAEHIKTAVTHRRGICEMTMEELTAIVDEAHRYGVKVACHAGIEPGIGCAAEAGVDSIEHGWSASEASIRELAERGTYWVPTLSVLRGPIDDQLTWEEREARHHEHRSYLGQDDLQFEEALAYFHSAWHNIETTFTKMRDYGVPIAVGTDAPLGGLPIDAAINEIEWFVELGMSPLEAIRAATGTAAEVIDRADRLGTIAPDKLADLLVVKGNPLENIKNLRSPYMVLKEGKMVRREA